METTYEIIHFDETTAQIVIQVKAHGVNLPPTAIDLPVDANGNVPGGAALDQYIKGFIPYDFIERQRKVKATGIANAANIRDLVKPLPAPPPPVITPVTLTEYAEKKRYLLETAGIDFNGIPIFTDDRTKMMLMGARMKAEKNPNATEKWPDMNGVIHTIDAPTIIAISDAVAEHVSYAFQVFADVKQGIDAKRIKTNGDVDKAFADAMQGE